MCDLNSMRTYRQLLALRVLLTAEQVIPFETDSQCADTDEQLARFETAKLNNEKKVRVVYCIFAECCVAGCLQTD